MYAAIVFAAIPVLGSGTDNQLVIETLGLCGVVYVGVMSH